MILVILPTQDDACLLFLLDEFLHQPEVLLLVVTEPLHGGQEGDPDEEVEEGREPVVEARSKQTRLLTSWRPSVPSHLSFFLRRRTGLG